MRRKFFNLFRQSGSEEKLKKTVILSKETREKATELAEEGLNFNDFPKTCSGFESAFNSLKKRQDVLYNYLKFFEGKNLPNIYKTSEMSYQVLIGILGALKAYGIQNETEASITIDYLQNIGKTKNFSLIKRFLKKKDKEGK